MRRSLSCWAFFGSLLILVVVQQAESYRCEKENIFDNTEFFSCPGPQDPSTAIYCCGNKLTRFCCSTPSSGDDEWIGKRKEESPVELDSGLSENEIIPDLSDSVAEKVSIVQGLAKLVGIIIGVAIFVIVVCVVCCCCCPFCLLAKKRSRGQILRQNENMEQQPALPAGAAYNLPPDQYNQQQQQQFLQQQPQFGPGNMPYPTQAPSPMGYPPQGGMAYPPYNAGYPPQGQGFPPQGGMAYPPGYPAGANPPPYPGLAESHPSDYQPNVEKAAYQTQPAFNPNY